VTLKLEIIRLIILGASWFWIFPSFRINKAYHTCIFLCSYISFVWNKIFRGTNVEYGASCRLSHICRTRVRTPALHLHLLTSRDCLINDTAFWIIWPHDRFSYYRTYIWHAHFQPRYSIAVDTYQFLDHWFLWSLMICITIVLLQWSIDLTKILL